MNPARASLHVGSTSTGNADELLTTDDLSLLIRTPKPTLRWWRHQGVGPRAFRLGARKVMYKRSDVEAWLDEQYNAAPPAA